MTKDQYAEYLRTPRWRAISKAIREAFEVCQRCSFPYELNVHHRTYERLGAEKIPDDLILLCRACHSREHFVEDWEKHPHLYGSDIEEGKKRILDQQLVALRKNAERKAELDAKDKNQENDDY